MIGDSLEELETLDQPRGVVRAANLYGQDVINLVARLQGMATSENPEETLQQACQDMSMIFDAFTAGAKWAAKTLTGAGCKDG